MITRTLLPTVALSLALALTGCDKSQTPDAGSSDGSSAATQAGFGVINATEFGQVLGADKPKATDIKSAIESTFPELAQFFGQKPKLGGAYEDSKNHKTGGATFTATHDGQPVRGIISCKMVDSGATVVVIYCRTDAPADAWGKLTASAAAPEPKAAGANPLAADNNITLHNYDFPDGTGSIGLPDGWKTSAQSIFNPIVIQGPREANLTLGSTFIVDNPNSPTAKSEAHFNIKRYLAPFTDPPTAIQELWPQMSKNSEANGGPSIHIDKIVSQDEMKNSAPTEKASVIVFDVTRTTNGKPAQYRNKYIFRMHPIGADQWQMTMRGFSAPVASFDNDSPTMFAIYSSLKVNNDVAAKVGKEKLDENAAVAAANLDAFKQRGVQQQKDHDDYMARTQHDADVHNAQFKADQLQKSRHNADEVEMIIGITKVVDTQTGQTARVDNLNVNQIVDTLNANEPGRYHQLPLRDELYPQN